MMTVCRKLSLDECSLLIIGEWADWLSWCQIKALKQSIMGYQTKVNQPQAKWSLTTDGGQEIMWHQRPRSSVTEEHLRRGYNRVMWCLHLSWFYKHQSLTENYEGPFLVVVHAPPARPRVNDCTCLPLLRSRDFLSATEVGHLVRSCSRSHGEISCLDMHTNSHTRCDQYRVWSCDL